MLRLPIVKWRCADCHYRKQWKLLYSVGVPAGTNEIDIVDSTLPDGAVETVGTDPTTVGATAGGNATDLHVPCIMHRIILFHGRINQIANSQPNGITFADTGTMNLQRRHTPWDS